CHRRHHHPMTDPIPADQPSDLDAVRSRLEATEQQLANYKLVAADYENARKRMVRDAEAFKRYAAEGLVKDLLTPLDNLDRALTAAKAAGESGPLVAGVAATASQLLDALRRHGVTRIEVGPGTPFDPHVHEAVSQQPTNDFEPGQVVLVVAQGFQLHDRVLRPAAVVVASAPPAGGHAG
ncbi:MAG: nucleotide exchange factor GrpE, partial [Gemmataceae bacterium]|nr:nucleotide exchange factor GrpE [Gemmataceae bacterium]